MNPRLDLELKDDPRDLRPVCFFTVNCLLYSRMEAGLVSDPGLYDEDVNVYLAHLLHSFINPEYAEQSRRYLSKYDADVFRRLAHAGEARLKYRIHRTDADFLLVSVGLFEHEPPPPGRRPKQDPVEEAYVGRGKTYYHFAYTYSRYLPRRGAGVPEMLERLAVGFDKYVRILSHMRGEPLDLARRLESGECYQLARTLNQHVQEDLLRHKQDELLELYSAWRKAPTPETIESLERVVDEIRQLNPGFRFELPPR